MDYSPWGYKRDGYNLAPKQQRQQRFWMIVVVVQLLSHVQLFATPWTAACQASLSSSISQSFLKLMSIESVMPSNHLILCHPFSSCLQSFPASGSLPMSQFFPSGDHSIGVSAFGLKSILTDTNIGIPDLFWLPFSWKNLFLIFHFWSKYVFKGEMRLL